jgi:P4 family phage/plasmid primase-like protien
LPDAARWRVLTLSSSFHPHSPITITEAPHREFNNLLDAVLAAAEVGTDVEREERAMRAAKEAAALVYPEALEPAVGKIVKRFRGLGRKGLLPQRVLKDIQELAGKQSTKRTAAEAAAQFHDHARQAAGLESGAAIRYYRQEFFVWRRRCWQRIEDANFEAQVTEFLQRDPSFTSLSRSFLGDVVANVKGQTNLPCWERPLPLWVRSEKPLAVRRSPYLAFGNRLVDVESALESDDLPRSRRPDPRHFSEVVLPYRFDPTAECPLWEQTLGEIFPSDGENDHRIEVLQEFMGWCLPDVDMRYERFLILVGPGANGKSTIMKVWRELLGPDNVSHVPLEELESEFRLMQMDGKLANMAADMNYVGRVAEGRLKELVSGDAIQVNRKHKAPITMVPTAKLIFACNQLPQFADRSDGIWRRLIVIPFQQQFAGEEIDRDRACRLREERPGIFNWALEGARRLNRQGDFTRCRVCARLAQHHRRNSDPFRLFVAERTQRGPDQLPWPQSAAYTAYREFCEDNGRKPANSCVFKDQMLVLDGVGQTRPGAGPCRLRCYTGIRLRQ